MIFTFCSKMDGLIFALLWTFLLFPNLLAGAAEIRRVTAVRDDLELQAVYEDKLVPESAEVRLQLRNISDRLTSFARTERELQLAFTLFDRSGLPIAMDPDWARKNYLPSAFGLLSETQLAAGASRTLTLHLDKAFGSNWKDGARLQVDFDLGPDGVKYLSKAKGLSVVLYLHEAPPEVAPESSEPNGKRTGRVVILVPFALIAFIVGVFVLRRKWDRQGE